MYLSHIIYYVFVFSFLINMFIIPLLTTHTFRAVSIFNTSKFYLSIITGLLLVLTTIYSYDIFHETKSNYHYMLYVFLLIVYIYLYRNQIHVSDKSFFKDIKERNSTIILLTNRKSKNQKVNSFIKYINTTLNKQNDFINKII